jgi:hypothetical protein
MVVADVFAQRGRLAGVNTPGDVAAILPDLEFEIRAEANLPAVGGGSGEVLLREGSPLHEGDGADLFEEGFTDGVGLRLHVAMLPMCIETVKAKKNQSRMTGLTFLSCTPVLGGLCFVLGLRVGRFLLGC